MNWKKVAEKFLWALADILVAGTVVYLTDNGLFLVIVPVLQAFRNWAKHR